MRKKDIGLTLAITAFVAAMITSIFLRDFIIGSLFNAFQADQKARMVFAGGNWGTLYFFGFLILCIWAWWFISSKINPSEDRPFRVAFKKKIYRKHLLIGSIIIILVSFARFSVLSQTAVNSFDMLSSDRLTKMAYGDIEAVNVHGTFAVQHSNRGPGYCRLKGIAVSFISAGKIAEINATNIQAYDLGNIFRTKGLIPNVTYSNSCARIPEDQKDILRYSFDVIL